MSEKDKKSALDKIVMGAIIGTAIGSAIGMSLAPKKGEETRKIIGNVVKEKTGDAKEVAKVGKETVFGILSLAKRILFGKSKSSSHGLKKIPDESVEIIEPRDEKTN